MISLREVLRTKRAARGLAIVLSGSVVGQGAVVLSSPLLTRLFDPSDFGLLGVYTALVAMVGVLATSRLEQAVSLPREDADAAAVATAALVLTAVVAGVTHLVGLVAGGSLAAALGTPRLADLWWLVALGVAATGVTAVMSGWLIRRQAYGPLGRRNGLQGLVQVGVQVGAGLTGVGAPGLLAGVPLGRLCGVGGVMSRQGLLRQRFGRRRPWAMLVRYRRFPLVASWGALINSAGVQLPVIVVAAAYGAVPAGLLALAIRVVVAPTAFVGAAVADVFVGEVARHLREREPRIERLVRSTARRLLAVGALPALLVVVTGPWLFEIVFGPDWVTAGVFAQVLVVGYVGQFVVFPVSQVLGLAERQTWALAWDVTRVVLVVGGVVVCAALGGSVTAAVTVLSVAALGSYVLLFVLCVRAGRLADRTRVDGPADDTAG